MRERPKQKAYLRNNIADRSANTALALRLEDLQEEVLHYARFPSTRVPWVLSSAFNFSHALLSITLRRITAMNAFREDDTLDCSTVKNCVIT